MRAMLSRRSLMAGLGGAACAATPADAQVADGYRTVLFDTAASYDPGPAVWSIPLHAWVYAPQSSTVRKAAIAALFKRRYGLQVEPQFQALFDNRINLLLADNKRGQVLQVAVRAQGEDVMYRPLARTGANGHTRLEIAYGPDSPTLKRFAELGIAGKNRQVLARAHLIPQVGVSIISDIDDTVKDSGVLDKKRLFEATFFKPFRAVPGMANLLKRLAGDDGAVHYVSSSPWHLYQPLRDWLAADGFPVSALHLKQIRLKDSSILDILKSPVETKPPVIAEILKRYPKRRFILVGDSGEKDPEVYVDAYKRFQGQISRILIRRAPGDRSDPARFERLFAGLPTGMAQVFATPDEIAA
jgi:Uncharacterized conserved protein (DUF2183)